MKVIRTILFILNLLLAVGLVLTTLAGVVRPTQTLLPSLLAYGYLPLLIANVAMVLLWLLMKRWEFLLSVAAIALRWSMVGLFFQMGGTATMPSRDKHPQMVTVMSYNLRRFHGLENRPAQSDTNAREFLSLVGKYEPDVLCLQEFAAPKTVQVTDSLKAMGYKHYYGTHTSSSGLPYGTVLFSRLPMTYVSRIDNKKLLVELQAGEHPLRVCCIHMDSYRFDESDREEIERMRHGEVQESSRRTFGKVKETILSHETEWEQYIKPVVTASTVPLIVAGDLNDIPNSWLYSQMAAEMSDSYREKGLGFGSTYNGGEGRLLPSGHDWLPRFRIDVVFHSEGLTTLSYKRLKSNLSDHYPILTALEFVP